MTARTLPNPFEYLRRNAELRPRAAFSVTPVATLTNAEALEAATRMAYELRRLGVRPGDLVAIDTPDAIGALLTEAVWHESAISTVLPARYPADGPVRPDWLLTSSTADVPATGRVVRVDAAFLQHVEENPFGIRPREEPLETLRVVFTSGTTGTPKAVALGRRMEVLMDAVLDTYFAAGTPLMLMDLGTAAGIGEFFLSVKAGVPFLHGADLAPDDVVRLARTERAAALKGSPAQLAAVAARLRADGQTLEAVRAIQSSGVALSAALADGLRETMPNALVISAYGSTEAGGATIRVGGGADPTDAGTPAPGAEIGIVDDDDHPLPPGQEGSIRIRTAGMAHEYLGEPDATAQAFRDGWFHPGDRGLLRPDGGLTLRGRDAEVLNAGGVKVDPAALDVAVLAHPGIDDAMAFAYSGGDGAEVIGVAYVADEAIDARPLHEGLRARFGEASPSLIVRLDELPRTSTGKPLRRVLAERFDGGVRV